MRTHLTLAGLVAALVIPVAAGAQSYTVGRGVVVEEDAPLITVERRPEFREYVVR